MICCLAASVAHLHFSMCWKERQKRKELADAACAYVLVCICDGGSYWCSDKGESSGPLCRDSDLTSCVPVQGETNKMIILQGSACSVCCTALLHYSRAQHPFFGVGVKVEGALSKGENESTDSKKRQRCSVNFA